MDINEIVNIALPIVYVLVGAAIIWLIVELVMTARRARKTVEEVQQQIAPTLASVERITASLEPVAAKVDPLIERVSLTVDAVNLEIMRFDQILEDVGEITDSVASAVDAVDTVASAPMDLVNSVTNRVRGVFKTRKASDESVALGQGKADHNEFSPAGATQTVKKVVQSSIEVGQGVVADQREQHDQHKAEREARTSAKQVSADKAATAAASVAEAVTQAASAEAHTTSKYFKYEGDEKPNGASGAPSQV